MGGTENIGNAPYEVLELNSLDENAIRGLAEEEDKTEVVFQWIKTLMVENINLGVLSIPPPILTRVFQELDAAMSKYHKAETFSKVPFPFPYVATIDIIMFIHWAVTPVSLVSIFEDSVWPMIVAWIFTFILWSMYLIAAELENPFNGDPNDLDLQNLQCTLNNRLLTVVSARSHAVPRITDNLQVAVGLLDKARREADGSKDRKSRTSFSNSLLLETSCLQPAKDSRTSCLRAAAGADPFMSVLGLAVEEPPRKAEDSCDDIISSFGGSSPSATSCVSKTSSNMYPEESSGDGGGMTPRTLNKVLRVFNVEKRHGNTPTLGEFFSMGPDSGRSSPRLDKFDP